VFAYYNESSRSTCAYVDEIDVEVAHGHREEDRSESKE
jgi:hypothetical protein